MLHLVILRVIQDEVLNLCLLLIFCLLFSSFCQEIFLPNDFSATNLKQCESFGTFLLATEILDVLNYASLLQTRGGGGGGGGGCC